MLPFLKKVAQKIYQEYEEQIENICIVLPTRRACIYFRNYLYEIVRKPILCPKIFSIDDFFYFISKSHRIDNINLILNLFRCFDKYNTDKQFNLDAFAPLGITILRDFISIDKNLNSSEAEKLFQFLEKSKAIERWSEEFGKEISLEKHKSINTYFTFWENLIQVYKDFKTLSLSKNQLHSGLVYQKVLENIDKLLEAYRIQHLVLAGFNQFTKLEEDLFKTLLKKEKATIFWDVDIYYFKKEIHEAGYFMRRYAQWISREQMDPQSYIETQSKRIAIYQVNNIVSQGKLVGDLLQKELNKIKVLYKNNTELKKTYRQTAILLPDENLLLPLLYSLPEKIDFSDGSSFQFSSYLNVTMGLKIQNTPLFELLKVIFLFQESLPKDDIKETFIYYKPLVSLLQHPYLQQTSCREVLFEIQSDLKKNKGIYISVDSYLEKFSEKKEISLLLKRWQRNYQSAIEYICSILKIIYSSLRKKRSSLERNFIYGLFIALKQLNTFLDQSQISISMKSFKFFLFEVTRHINIPFTGESISPFQIMGMLESRALDFEKVIILSCNEGILPKGKVIDSVIPYEIRQKNKLPTYQEQDAESAYIFYRLLHQSKDITLIYTSPSTTLQGNEKSRFLLQIENELCDMPNISIQNYHLKIDMPPPKDTSPKVFKNESLIKKIKEKIHDGLSPTDVSLYIKNPLKFLYKKILNLKESFEIEEKLDHRTFGIVIHKSLQKIFEFHRVKYIQKSDIELALKGEYIQEIIGESVQELFGKIELEKGKNYILLNIASQLIQNFLKKQIHSTPFYILNMENFLSHTIEIFLNEHETVPFRILGQADRIDIIKNQIRIVEYKTGGYIANDLKCKDWKTLLNDPRKEKIVQLLLYKYLLLRTLEIKNINEYLPQGFEISQCEVRAGFYFFRNISDDFTLYDLTDEPKETHRFIVYVENILRILINHLLDTDREFSDKPADFSDLV